MKSMTDMELVQILWDYMQLHQRLEKCDCIIGLGCMDLNVAKVAANLYKKGYADKLIFSGGYGKKTKKVWNEPEAEKFAKIAIEMGVPKEKIYLENQSTNTSENFEFVKKLIEENKMNLQSCIIVGRPYVEKRTYTYLKKIMPEYKAIITSEAVRCETYFNRYKSDSKIEEISVLVGDIQRMKLYPQKGWSTEVDIPDEVWQAYEELVKRGYNNWILEN